MDPLLKMALLVMLGAFVGMVLGFAFAVFVLGATLSIAGFFSSMGSASIGLLVGAVIGGVIGYNLQK